MAAPTPLFTLKNLTFQHHMSPMKIGTDALLLGAYPKFIAKGDQVLEVGSGCGIITLMTHKQYPDASFTCLDIDENAFQECQINILQNGLEDMVKSVLGNVKDFHLDQGRIYNVVISNPPFFTSEMKPNNESLKKAKHTDHLSINELAGSVNILLNDGGFFYVILPIAESQQIIDIFINMDINLVERMDIRSVESKECFRSILVFKKKGQKENLILKQMTLYNSSQRNDWTKEYRQLLQNFKEFN